MQNLHWELSVLSRAIAYKNLSGASSNVGISQPQLSRILARLEAELNLVLLDRSSRRNSSWTSAAFRLAELYSKNSHRLEREIQKVVGDTEPTHLKIGTLEGLISLANAFGNHLFKSDSLKRLEIDVYDLNRLEQLYFEGELDLIFISREPGKKKLKYSRKIAHQVLELVNTGENTLVFSSFEHQTRSIPVPPNKDSRILISNSLAVRKGWIESYGGVGRIPSDVRRSKFASDQDQIVFLIASDILSPLLWQKALKFKF